MGICLPSPLGLKDGERKIVGGSSKSSVLIIIIVWLVRCWTLPFYERAAGLTTLCWMTGGYQTNVEWCEIRFNGPEPGVTMLAQSAVPVPWQRGHTGPKGSTFSYLVGV